jgi:quercetin dioxygenase-like cupin family protein
MSRFIAAVLVLACACITVSSIALWPTALTAQAVGESREIAPGVVRKNLGEYPSNVPGFEKVRIVEDTVQPGATYGTESMPAPMFCTALKGEATIILDGKEQKVKAGDSYVCALGQKGESKNTGSEPYVERMHHLLKAGQ